MGDCYLSVAFFGPEKFAEKHPVEPFATAKNACIFGIRTVKITVFFDYRENTAAFIRSGVLFRCSAIFFMVSNSSISTNFAIR